MKYDILLAKVYFDDNPSQAKVRPIPELGANQAMILGSKITSHLPRPNYADKYQIKNYYGTGLTKKSTIRLSKTFSIPKINIIKKLGKLSSLDINNIQKLGY